MRGNGLKLHQRRLRLEKKVTLKPLPNAHYEIFLFREKTFKVEGNDFWKISASKNTRQD